MDHFRQWITGHLFPCCLGKKESTAPQGQLTFVEQLFKKACLLRRGKSGPSTQEKAGEKRDGLQPLGEAGEFYFNKVRLEIKVTTAGTCMQPAPVRVEAPSTAAGLAKDRGTTCNAS